MALVAGVDSSTQSCKVVVRDAETGELVRSGRASHPDGTAVHPDHWWTALAAAVQDAGGLDGVSALSVGGQQHGMVALDSRGEVVREALLWNDTRSAGSAEDLITELGDGDREAGAAAWAQACGSVLVASLTITKLRWLRDAEPENAARVAGVALPHDWLTWRLAGAQGLDTLVTDRSDASGTGYWSPSTEDYRRDLLELALGRGDVALPRVVPPAESAGTTAGGLIEGVPAGIVLGPGAGDNAAAALGMGMRPGDVALSIGTSGVVSAVTPRPTTDASGLVNGFADATGQFLALGVTLNASRILDAACRLLGIDHEELSRLALAAPPGADGLALVPFFEGERTPNRPDATAALHGMTLATTTPEHLARAAVEGLLCSLADGLDALREHGITAERIFLIGGGAQSEAVRRIAPAILGTEVLVPPTGEYVADGAARQAAWVLLGAAEPPDWGREGTETFSAEPTPHVRERYAEVREMHARRLGQG